MTGKDDVDQDFRAATREVRGAPVRWHRVEEQARRHERAAFRGFGFLALIVTIVIAAGFIAIKLVVDPAYRAQLSSANTTIAFGEGAASRGHTRLGEYMQEAGVRPIPVGTLALQEEGFVFQGRLKLAGFQGRLLNLTWALRSTASGYPTPVATYASPATLRTPSGSLTATLQAWIGYPRATGSYIVELILRDTGGQVLSISRSHPFTVTAPRISTPYRSPSYEALLPTGWRFTEKYFNASPHRFVTKMAGPMGLSVVIDTTRHVKGDPASSAATVEDKFHGESGYRRVAFRRTNSVGFSAFEWSFESEHTRRTDIFFNEGDEGYAVLAVGPPRRAAEIRAVDVGVARSILSRTLAGRGSASG